jgi:hypothetical protein
MNINCTNRCVGVGVRVSGTATVPAALTRSLRHIAFMNRNLRRGRCGDSHVLLCQSAADPPAGGALCLALA